MADDFEADRPETDLLGDPVGMATAHIGRGEFQVTEENQEVVTVLAASGWTQERIARRIGCDPKTLRKHFSRELELAADTAEAEALLAIHRKARGGNVAAASKVLALAAESRAAVPMGRGAPASDAGTDAGTAGGRDAGTDGGTVEPASGARLGKKAQLEQDAQNPSDTWARLLN